MTSRHDSPTFGRRVFLRGAALAGAAAATAPSLESAASAAATDPDPDPDQLFKRGEFAAAGRGYRHRLRDDPGNAHAAAQVGYIALLSNRFGVAESFLARDVPGMAVEKVFPGLPGPGQSERFGFDLTANFTHEFFKPFAITFDYTAMDFLITRGRTRAGRHVDAG